jgi:LacI family transcriptional regulator
MESMMGIQQITPEETYALMNNEKPDENVHFRPRLEVRGSTGPAPQ